jgi:predicted Fe-Mo cluster-binding NifX family protein
MKIAVTTENNNVFQHFGKCEEFTVFEIEDGKIKNKSLLNSNGVGHGALADLLKENDIAILICGGIGAGAKEALKSAGIELIAGASGNVEQAVTDHLSGKLQNNADIHCDHHEHGDGHSCSGHC